MIERRHDLRPGDLRAIVRLRGINCAREHGLDAIVVRDLGLARLSMVSGLSARWQTLRIGILVAVKLIPMFPLNARVSHMSRNAHPKSFSCCTRVT